MLEIRIDRKCYPDRGGRPHVALSGLNLAVQRGEFVCVVGPSGCGKSTLLNIVGGLDRELDGRVTMNGAFPEDVGFMFQEPRLMPWMSVLDNVLLVAREGVSEGGVGRWRLRAQRSASVSVRSRCCRRWSSRTCSTLSRRACRAA